MRVFGQHTYLANSIDNELIPASNNALEMVIRRFDQHYQNFCGFESIATARLHLGVFEKIYRFTPFSNDARPGIRGKSSLQLAGFDLSLAPMSWLCRLTGFLDSSVHLWYNAYGLKRRCTDSLAAPLKIEAVTKA